MMKKAILVLYITITISVILLLSDSSYADPRAQIVESTCGTQLEHNTTIFVQNFFTSMEKIRAQMRASGFGAASTGSGPDTDYGLGQCYGDLSLNDCVLCHAGARTVLARCYPFNGVRVYLDGCFMRSENYSFFQEFIGPNDHAVCGNRTRQDLEFRVSTRRALSQAVLTAPNNNGYARVQVAVARKGNDSAYVLANCWRTIKASACRACLENASASILGCLPSSEGRALNTGCFMRYSDTDFLNPVLQGVLPDGREVAVKRLFFDNKHRAADFCNEVNIISSIEHKNLVRFLGCSCLGPETLLVYEFLPNKSLDRFIFG